MKAEVSETKCSFLLHSEGYMGAVPMDIFEMFCERFPDQVEHRKDYSGEPLKVKTWGFKGVSPDDPLLNQALDFANQISLEIPMDRSRMNSGIECYWGHVPTILVSKRLLKIFKELGIKRMDYKYGDFTVIDDEPWELGTDGPLHPRYSGPAPNDPVD